jgi:hypothetical protein
LTGFFPLDGADAGASGDRNAWEMVGNGRRGREAGNATLLLDVVRWIADAGCWSAGARGDEMKGAGENG